jgi:uncharacterized Zn finger protein (UPF0148 family)
VPAVLGFYGLCDLEVVMFRLYDMKVICAWCEKYLDTRKAISPGKTSHGICPECDKRIRKEWEESKAAKKKVA